MDDKNCAYEEVGRAHRYFLNWRHATFAGYFVILYGAASVIEKLGDRPHVLWLVLIFTGFVSLAFLLIDMRTREVYSAILEAGKVLENGNDSDLYGRLSMEPSWRPKHFPGPHSAAIWLIYLFGSVALFSAGAMVAWGRFCG